MDHVTWPRPFQGRFVICRLGLAMFNQHTKFEVSTITCYKEIKGNAKRCSEPSPALAVSWFEFILFFLRTACLLASLNAWPSSPSYVGPVALLSLNRCARSLLFSIVCAVTTRPYLEWWRQSASALSSTNFKLLSLTLDVEGESRQRRQIRTELWSNCESWIQKLRPDVISTSTVTCYRRNETKRAVWLITTADHIGPPWNCLRHLGTCYNNKNTSNQIIQADTTFL